MKRRPGIFTRWVTLTALAVMLSVVQSPPTWAQGVLENPLPGSVQSGISLVSGWKCTGGAISVQFDDWPPEEAAYGTSRPDTQGVCGDTDNGFGDLFNYNRLGDGIHTVRIFDNGQLFASSSFVVQTLGQEFLRGAEGVITVRGFPFPDQHISLVWQESKQAFTIAYFGIPATLTDLLGTWDLASLIDGGTVHTHYELQVIQGVSSQMPFIVGQDLDHGHSVIAGRAGDIFPPPQFDPQALPWDFYLFDIDPTVCRLFLFNKTAPSRIMGNEAQVDVVGNRCATSGGASFPMAGVRTSLTTSSESTEPELAARTPSAELSPSSEEKRVSELKTVNGEVLPVLTPDVINSLVERLHALAN
jgi:hypothetical protein